MKTGSLVVMFVREDKRELESERDRECVCVGRWGGEAGR